MHFANEIVGLIALHLFMIVMCGVLLLLIFKDNPFVSQKMKKVCGITTLIIPELSFVLICLYTFCATVFIFWVGGFNEKT